jgi:uncharacterized membrane protein
MRRLILSLALAASLLLHTPLAQASEPWRITSFFSDLTVTSDGHLQVTEIIQVDFGNTEKHGIFRVIPYRYDQEGNASLYTRVQVESVSQDESPAPYDIHTDNNNLTVKIGEAETLITGTHTYTLTYNVAGVLHDRMTEYDELYWNVTGNDWPVPIESATATVTLPKESLLQLSCYQGVRDSSTPCTSAKWDSSTKASFSATTLQEGEGLTIATGFSKGLVPILHPDPLPSVLETFTHPKTLGTFVLTLLLGLFLILRGYLTKGRDQGDRGRSIAPEYTPPANLRPAEISTLLDEQADTSDVSATIVDLANRGYMTITCIPKQCMFSKEDYMFTRTNKVLDDLLEYERVLISSIFDTQNERTMSDLTNTFASHLSQVKNQIYMEMVTKGLYLKPINQIIGTYVAAGIGLLLLGIVSTVLSVGNSYDPNSQHPLTLGFGVAVVLIGIVRLCTVRAMPSRTPEGTRLLRLAKGYKLFVSNTEKYRQPYFEKQNVFMDILPYAMVFGVTDKLVKAFQDMELEVTVPAWYLGGTSMDFIDFGSKLSTMASAPSSSGSDGGGSSGGGFGGGGGGSW